MNTFQIPEGTKEVKIDQVDNKIIVEFVKKFNPKDGDILFYETNNCVWIFKNKNCGYCGINYRGVLECDAYNTSISRILENKNNEYRFATDSEKQLLFDKLAEQGLRWNAEEKKIEKIRWRAKHGEEYWTFNQDEIYDTTDVVKSDNDRYLNGFYFQTKEQAEKAFEAVKNLLLNTKF